MGERSSSFHPLSAPSAPLPSTMETLAKELRMFILSTSASRKWAGELPSSMPSRAWTERLVGRFGAPIGARKVSNNDTGKLALHLDWNGSDHTCAHRTVSSFLRALDLRARSLRHHLPLYGDRPARRLLLTLLLWIILAFRTTQPGPRVDCYDVAIWNGKTFDPTGEWKCLK
jgi:hypothetical protein